MSKPDSFSEEQLSSKPESYGHGPHMGACKHWWVPVRPEVQSTYPPPPADRPTKIEAYCQHCGEKMP